MAKKNNKPPKSRLPKRKKSEARPPKSKSKAAPPSTPPLLPGGSDMEALMRQFLLAKAGELGIDVAGLRDNEPDEVYELIEQAQESRDPKKREKLLRQALELDPDNIDAYMLLAEEATTRKEVLRLTEEGVAAGERALGPEFFEEEAGRFWGLLETRPYMRARARLADVLWALGYREKAVEHLRELIRLNPNDNQGLRYILATRLAALGLEEELETLFERYDEDSAGWTYARALAAFRRNGDVPESVELLKRAFRSNRFVPAYLLGDKPLPPDSPESYAMGGDDEAVLYVEQDRLLWSRPAGALDWLRRNLPVKPTKSKKPPKKKPKSKAAGSDSPAIGLLPIVKARLAKIPQVEDVWQIDLKRFGPRLETEEGLRRPWFAIARSRISGLVHITDFRPDPYSAAEVWDLIAKSLQKPPVPDQPAHRPAVIEVRPDPIWDELRPHLKEIGIDVVVVDELPLLDECLESLSRHLGSDSGPSSYVPEGAEPETAAGLLKASAFYYRAAPWFALGYEAPIRISCPAIGGKPKYGIVLGQRGETFGLVLYNDLKTVRSLTSLDPPDESEAMEAAAVSLTYGRDVDVSDADLDLIESLGIEIPDPEAYPMVYYKEAGESLETRELTRTEHRLLEASLLAVPGFVESRRQYDAEKYVAAVETAQGRVEVELNWIEV